MRVLNALRDYRASEAAMRRRTRAAMSMGETDLLALRYLLEAHSQGRELSPEQAETVVDFLTRMAEAVDRIDPAAH